MSKFKDGDWVLFSERKPVKGDGNSNGLIEVTDKFGSMYLCSYAGRYPATLVAWRAAREPYTPLKTYRSPTISDLVDGPIDVLIGNSESELVSACLFAIDQQPNATHPYWGGRNWYRIAKVEVKIK